MNFCKNENIACLLPVVSYDKNFFKMLMSFSNFDILITNTRYEIDP
jgi:hypothetical protein